MTNPIYRRGNFYAQPIWQNAAASSKLRAPPNIKSAPILIESSTFSAATSDFSLMLFELGAF